MKIQETALKIEVIKGLEDELVLRTLSSQTGIKKDDIADFLITKISIDARSKLGAIHHLNVKYIQKSKGDEGKKIPLFDSQIEYKNVKNADKNITIIGFGPAGMFAALQAIELGIKPIVFERGKDVQMRRRDLANMNKKGIVNPESNYCFGEGGAGTYSDGKLYTRSSKRGDFRKILQVFYNHGADAKILNEAHPHIGTNKLPQIIAKMRETIIEYGGEIHFDSKLTDIFIEKDAINFIEINNSQKFSVRQIILATGHSARDIFELLNKKNIQIEAKPFALGVRVEHHQDLINKIQYKNENDRKLLPAAAYSLVHQVNEKGVFSFCMCPGGIIAPAATDENEIVVNGWSPSKRDGQYANSGMVVSVELNDIPAYQKFGELSSLNFQKEVEQKAFQFGGGFLKAPAQRMVDFCNNKISSDLPECSYLPGLTSADLTEVLPSFISFRLQKALKEFDKKMKGYFTNDAVLVGVESRTSSPVKIPRDKETLLHPLIKNLYPCGEGAGYAGGIASAAMDGEKIVLIMAGITENKQHNYDGKQQ